MQCNMKTRTDHLIPQAAALYPFDAGTLHLIHSKASSPNDIYAFSKGHKAYILRISTHDRDHTPQTIGEMEWLAFLCKRKVPVSMPLPMEDGRLVALLTSGGHYHDVCAFEKAQGTHCDKGDPNRWNTDIMEDWGYTIGRMHRETKDFTLTDERYRRGVFDGSEGLHESLSDVPAILEFAQGLVSRLVSMPRTKDTFGLIHNDFHQNNFFVNQNKVHVFDFDDSLYGYFALDIGIALHHAVRWGVSDLHVYERQAEGEKIVSHFMKGYKKANTLDDLSLRSIAQFMRYRQLCDFGWEYSPDHPMLEEQQNLLSGHTAHGCYIGEGMFV